MCSRAGRFANSKRTGVFGVCITRWASLAHTTTVACLLHIENFALSTELEGSHRSACSYHEKRVLKGIHYGQRTTYTHIQSGFAPARVGASDPVGQAAVQEPMRNLLVGVEVLPYSSTVLTGNTVNCSFDYSSISSRNY